MRLVATVLASLDAGLDNRHEQSAGGIATHECHSSSGLLAESESKYLLIVYDPRETHATEIYHPKP